MPDTTPALTLSKKDLQEYLTLQEEMKELERKARVKGKRLSALAGQGQRSSNPSRHGGLLREQARASLL